MNEATLRKLEEVREMLERSEDPADIAASMIKGSDGFVRELKGYAKLVITSLDNAKKQQLGLEKVGAGATEAQTLLKAPKRALMNLKELVDDALDGLKAAEVK